MLLLSCLNESAELEAGAWFNCVCEFVPESFLVLKLGQFEEVHTRARARQSVSLVSPVVYAERWVQLLWWGAQNSYVRVVTIRVFNTNCNNITHNWRVVFLKLVLKVSSLLSNNNFNDIVTCMCLNPWTPAQRHIKTEESISTLITSAHINAVNIGMDGMETRLWKF